MEEIQTFVFLDLETSGFHSYKERILELALMAVSRENLLSMNAEISKEHDKITPPSLPRITHRQTKFFRASTVIHPEAERVHGLNNFNLEHLNEFCETSAEGINNFLKFPAPICILAHNGDRYDFPILMAELKNVDIVVRPDLLSVDTLIGVRSLEGKVTETFSRSNKCLNNAECFKDSEQVPVANFLRPEDVSAIAKESLVNLHATPKPKYSTQTMVAYDQLSISELKEVDYIINLVENSDDFYKTESNYPSKISLGLVVNNLSIYESPLKSSHPLNGHPKPPVKSKKVADKPNVSLEKKGVKRSLNFYGHDGQSKHYKQPFSQPILYDRLFGTTYDAHRAEADVKALIQICSFYGQDFVSWADKNCSLFKNVKPKWTVKRKFV